MDPACFPFPSLRASILPPQFAGLFVRDDKAKVIDVGWLVGRLVGWLVGQACLNQAAIARYLVGRGADVEAKTEFGWVRQSLNMLFSWLSLTRA